MRHWPTEISREICKEELFSFLTHRPYAIGLKYFGSGKNPGHEPYKRGQNPGFCVMMRS
jgi:hypothetical protein